MQVVKLGTRELGTIEVLSDGVVYQKQPIGGKIAGNIILKVDIDTLKDIDTFYHSVNFGNIINGEGEITYYSIIGVIESNGVFNDNLSFQEFMEREIAWDMYSSEVLSNTKFIIEIY